ncbi:MAG: bifunctional (p)ppGpp synthetase/guanosine-3',5'-bis(diphosphate) 3'-pyrophosphohydrolase [Nannocystis sp.]|uniref:RelA/SpoT family protein n=1 Tax=Nannocystis sp. TaxID=1962667 RepID=UPI002420CBF6|nr:HD domain-containing protein [Nannocystis sp.]MBK9754950.1 bifunctional (p)ppGpp synthetase/guanosine-3',5'-bis(diphosphate) 3'-pyrophosphohydrolase [Nannocystis sp.]
MSLASDLLDPGAPAPAATPAAPAASLATAPAASPSADAGPSVAAILAELARRPGVDTAPVERAFELARRCHAGQMRKSGEPYLMHPLRVAETITRIGLDVNSVVAGLLHDAVEDSDLSIFDLTEGFGSEVASLVDGVTKLGKVPYLSRQEQQAESFRKMLLAMSQDIRVLLVKLADRLDNMRTLEHMPLDKQLRIARETMEIYAPLANRLGIQWLHAELQDLSFRYLEPAIYRDVAARIAAMHTADPDYVERGLGQLRAAFTPTAADPESPPEPGNPIIGITGVNGEDVQWSDDRFGPVELRATLRTPYQAYKLAEDADLEVDKVSSLVSFQIITRDRASCYTALGVLHGSFTPVPGRFRDYIALPRPNRYQALHTAVVRGVRLELQIRSQVMDAVAERGIVAEWQRSGGKDGGWQRLTWLQGLMDWLGEVQDPHEFIEAVKADLFADEVYVFTPEGDIHTFPRGATPIDFAFAIHTNIGVHCSGARVNGHLVPLRYQLRQGDTIEILTNPAPCVRKEWLKMCHTSRAQTRIKQWLRQEERLRLRALGRSLVEQELSGRGRTLAEFEEIGLVARRAAEFDLGKDLRDVPGADGLYEAVGSGQLASLRVADALAPRDLGRESGEDDNLIRRMFRRMSGSKIGGKIGEGISGSLAGNFAGFGRGSKSTARGERPEPGEGAPGSPMMITRERTEGAGSGVPMIQLAPCCSPVPGDPLLGYFAPGKGIIAHVETCPQALDRVEERRVYLAWQPELELDGAQVVEVRTANAVGLLAEMSRAFSHHGINIKQANCRTYDSGQRAINTFHTSVKTLAQLSSLMRTLKGIPGVLGVERVFSRSAAGLSD